MSVWIKCDNCETMAQLDDRPCDRVGDLSMPAGWSPDFPNQGHLCSDCRSAVKLAVEQATSTALTLRQPQKD